MRSAGAALNDALLDCTRGYSVWVGGLEVTIGSTPTTGGEQAANTLQPDGKSRHATTLDAKVGGAIEASLLVMERSCLFSHGTGPLWRQDHISGGASLPPGARRRGPRRPRLGAPARPARLLVHTSHLYASSQPLAHDGDDLAVGPLTALERV